MQSCFYFKTLKTIGTESRSTNKKLRFTIFIINHLRDLENTNIVQFYVFLPVTLMC